MPFPLLPPPPPSLTPHHTLNAFKLNTTLMRLVTIKMAQYGTL